MGVKKKTLFIVLLILIPLIGIGAFVASIKDPAVDIVDIRFSSLSLSKGTMTFIVTVDVDNPNRVGATLESVDVKVSVDDQYTGAVDHDVGKKISARSTTQVELEFVLKNVPVITSTTVDVTVKGTVDLSVSFLSFTKDIHKTERVELI